MMQHGALGTPHGPSGRSLTGRSTSTIGSLPDMNYRPSSGVDVRSVATIAEGSIWPGIVATLTSSANQIEEAAHADLATWKGRATWNRFMTKHFDYYDMEIPVATTAAQKFVHTPCFQAFVGIVIVFNLIIIIAETDKSTDESAGNGYCWRDIASWFCLIFFIFELILRLLAEGWEFWKDKFNVFDFTVIAIDSIVSLVGLIYPTALPLSTLRVVRLSKVARVSKIFRVFPELRLMMAGMVGSARAIFWGTVLLALMCIIWGIIGVQFIHPINLKLTENGYYDDHRCDRCPRAYETVLQASLTITQQVIAGDSWGMVTLPIIEQEPAAFLYFAGVLVSVGMSVINLLLGVIVNVATQAREDLRETLEDERIISQMEKSGILTRICAEMDLDESGDLSQEELYDGYDRHECFRRLLQELHVQREDLCIMWLLLDPNNTGKVSFRTLISHCYSLKASDTQWMLAYVKYHITKLSRSLLDQVALIEQEVSRQQSHISHASHMSYGTCAFPRSDTDRLYGHSDYGPTSTGSASSVWVGQTGSSPPSPKSWALNPCPRSNISTIREDSTSESHGTERGAFTMPEIVSFQREQVTSDPARGEEFPALSKSVASNAGKEPCPITMASTNMAGALQTDLGDFIDASWIWQTRLLDFRSKLEMHGQRFAMVPPTVPQNTNCAI